MTDYIVARTAEDYTRCHLLLEEEGRNQDGISFPTIMAIKDDELTAVLCTHVSDGMIVAGPVAIKGGQPRYWTFIRLIEAYENVMRGAGVTMYIFSVPNEEERYLELIHKLLGIEPYAEVEGRKFFDRRL